MSEGPEIPFVDTVEGEISFYRSVMRARPVGIHSHFHVLTIRNAILKDTGHAVTTEEIWEKLRGLYDLDALEGLVRSHDFLSAFDCGMTGRQSQEPDGYESAESDGSTPPAIRSPSPSENLSNHPHFHSEYSLPADDTFESLITPRRMRVTASPPSSPHAPSPVRKSRGNRAKRGPSKADMAGLVGGDSDSSALTQESGDESETQNARESVATGMDGGTEPEEEDEEAREQSAGIYYFPCSSFTFSDSILHSGPTTMSKALRKPQPPRGDSGKLQKGTKSRTAAATAASSAVRSAKKRKK
jgi:MRG-binding protein